jgi:ribA/ribD-fused uncharacterized protein
MPPLPSFGIRDQMFESAPEEALFLSRLDPNELVGTFSHHPFQLDDLIWNTVEHYIQAMKFIDESKQEKIRLAVDPGQARKLGKTGWFTKPREDWPKVRRTYMTRAVYTKCRAHDAVAQALLATGTKFIVENDQYDYFWGCGRDRRGENAYGAVLMQVREKLVEERI